MGMEKVMVERLTIVSDERWVWEPMMFGVAITDDFQLSTRYGKTVLTIRSSWRATGKKGRLAELMLGPYLARMMVREWESASEAMVAELTAAALDSRHALAAASAWMGARQG